MRQQAFDIPEGIFSIYSIEKNSIILDFPKRRHTVHIASNIIDLTRLPETDRRGSLPFNKSQIRKKVEKKSKEKKVLTITIPHDDKEIVPISDDEDDIEVVTISDDDDKDGSDKV